MQKGFALVYILVGIVALVLIAGGAYYIGKFQISKSQNLIIASPSPSLEEIDGKSGIMGKIVLGPTCPAVGPGMENECQDKPYQATVAVKTSDGTKEITKFTSDAEGNFKVSLAPGDYLLVPISIGRSFFGKPQNVTVKEGEFTSVTIPYDTGIR